MKRKKRNNTVKYNYLIIVFSLFLFGVMIYRMFYLSMSTKVDGTNLQKLASKRTMREETIKAERGTIYSNNNDILAQNVSSYTLIAYLDSKRTTNKDKPQHVVDKDKTAEELAPILGMSKDEVLSYLNREGVYQTEFGSHGRNLSELDKTKIEALKLPGIDFIEKSKRYYPKGNFMSYTLGYATSDDNGNIDGKMGLELYYDNILKGEDGKRTYQKDLRGYKISGTKEYVKPAENGKDIYLTVDSNIQFFIEQALKEAKDEFGYEWFTMVIADAKTGAILGLSSNPNFDPNTRENITNYLDHTVSIPYEPGSTMKTYTYMAAMENGVYDGNETYQSGTYTTTDGTVIGDWNDKRGWGIITFDKGYALSSNVGVINLINRHMNSAMLRNYFRRLGFGKKTGIQLPNEAKGSLNFKYETEIFNAGFGQGITTTPMQNIQALTVLTNNGVLMKPYLVKKIVDKDTNEVIYKGEKKEGERLASQDTVNKMLKLMDDTVNVQGNTAYGYRIDSGELIGKTGTAQIANPNGGGYLTGKEDIISSFAGIYPKSNPEIIIYTSMSHPTGGSQKGIQKAIKEVISNVAKYYGESVSSTEVTDKVIYYKMDSFVNKSLDNAKTKLSTSNIANVIVLGNGNTVINQYPDADTNITNKDKVFLLTENIKDIPDINGYSRSDAEHLLTLLGYKVNVTGKGYVTGYTVDNDTVQLQLNPKFVESGE